MAESRLVPCNLMAWPRVRNLLPDQKLIIYHLWGTAPSSAGCYLLDFAGFSAALSINIAALEEALQEFERRQLVKMDMETGEVFIIDWFRFHKFDGAKRGGLLENDIKKIQSTKLKNLVIEKSMACAPREEKGREGKIKIKPPPPAKDCAEAAGAASESSSPPTPKKATHSGLVRALQAAGMGGMLG